MGRGLGDRVRVSIHSSRRSLRIKQLHVCRCQVPVKHIKVLNHVLRCVRPRDSYCATLHKPTYCHLCCRLSVSCRNSVGCGVLKDFPYSEWGVGCDRLLACIESVVVSLPRNTRVKFQQIIKTICCSRTVSISIYLSRKRFQRHAQCCVLYKQQVAPRHGARCGTRTG